MILIWRVFLGLVVLEVCDKFVCEFFVMVLVDLVVFCVLLDIVFFIFGGLCKLKLRFLLVLILLFMVIFVVGWLVLGVVSGNDVKLWLIGVCRFGCWFLVGEDVCLGLRERLVVFLVKFVGLVVVCGVLKGLVCGWVDVWGVVWLGGLLKVEKEWEGEWFGDWVLEGLLLLLLLLDDG